MGAVGWAFYYINGNAGVFRNQTLPALSGVDTVVVLYPSPLPYVAMARNAASVAAEGLRQELIEVKDIDDRDQLQDMADAGLLRAVEEPVELEVVTRTGGFEPGQLLTVNTALPLVASSTFLVESVHSSEVGQFHFLHMLKLSNTQYQQTSGPNRFFGDLIARDRLTMSRVAQEITTNLAPTLEGLTNPGLTVGIKPASRESRVKGVLAPITMRFNSVDTGTLTTSLIQIDVLKNGATVFASGIYITYPIGQTGIVQEWRFVVEPTPVAVGDVFTIHILSADATAKDGTLIIRF